VGRSGPTGGAVQARRPIRLQRGVSAPLVYAALQFFEASEEKRAQYLDLFCPDPEAALRGLAAPLLRHVHELPLPPNVPPTFFRDLALRWDANCIQVGDSADTAVYPTACRVNHACRANGYWYSVEATRFVRALRDIAAGEEFTISYLTGEDLLRPTAHRRLRLWKTKYFLCDCERCMEPDLTRKFRCPSCGDGYAVPHTSDPPAAEGNAWLTLRTPPTCLGCGATMSAKDWAALEAIEKKAYDRWQLLERTLRLKTRENVEAALAEVTDRLHPDHWLAYELHDMLADYHTQGLHHADAASHHAHRRRYIAGLNAGPLPQLWWTDEFLGDRLQNFSDAAQSAAEECYMRAAAGLGLMYPEDHPYARDAADKLLTLQTRRRAPIQCDGPGCGATKAPGQVFKRCSQCRSAVYCGVGCQRAHWKAGHSHDCPTLKTTLEAILAVAKTPNS